MCRILGYLGPSISLDHLVLKPENSMQVQSYKPKELEAAVLNGDGFGLGWHDQNKATEPFIYRNVLPMWNDRSLEDLCRYIHAENFVVNVRSATDKMPLDISNTQPCKWSVNGKQIIFVHNGMVEKFFETLHRPIREMLCDTAYRMIQGITDSEHIFALLVHYLETQPGIDVAEAFKKTMETVASLAKKADVRVAANIIISVKESAETSDEKPQQNLIALRYDNKQKPPSFYWLKNPTPFPGSVILSSEQLFEAEWQPYKPGELVSIDTDLNFETYATIA